MFRRSLACRLWPVAAVALALGALGGSTSAAVTSPGWRVFTPADSSLPMSANVLANPGFEAGGPGRAEDWQDYGSGYEIDETGGRGGGRALQLVGTAPGQVHGARQVVILDQSTARPLYLSGFSRAQNVSGEPDANYSVYLDIRYADGSWLYGQTIRFATGNHGWQFVAGFVVPARPIASVAVYCLLRHGHAGTVWFDDLAIREVEAELVTFDGVQVATRPPATPPYGGAALTVASGDGLGLTLTADGGAITAVTLAGQAVGDARGAYAGGFLVRDWARRGDFVHVGGTLRPEGDTVSHRSSLAEMGLAFQASYRAAADRIAIHAELEATPPVTRAVTLYFALPIDAVGWRWGDDIRTERPVEGARELANYRYRSSLGANGNLSKYPWAALSGPAGGIAMAVPLDSPRVMRLVHNPATNQFYVAFDLGLSPLTARFPSRAWVDFILYRFDPEWGFRAAAQGYYDRWPQYFARRLPPEREGIWVAFSDLSPIPRIEDFGIAFHELGSLNQVPFDDAHGILSFRYIAEPWSHWLRIDDPGVDPADYDQVVDYLRRRQQAGDRRSEATLASGFFDERGRLRYLSTVAPWCRGVAGCAVFTVNPDPDIQDPDYPTNKGHLEWNQEDWQTYETLPGLDGEYIDSYLGRATELDFRVAHFAAADTPLTFRSADGRVGIPEVFATTEFARWLTGDVHGRLGRWTMANGMLSDLPWGAELFEFMGRETNWLRGGKFVPDPDSRLAYQRTLAYQRPYGLLMNTNFDNLSAELVERYFLVALFYGIYPSMFSHNAAEDRYWDDPALYERDRPLFRRYVPLIRDLNRGGWRPVTYAHTTTADVYIERFGAWPDLRFTLRNMSDTEERTADVLLHADRLGITVLPSSATALVAGTRLPLTPAAALRSVTLTLAPHATEVLHLAGWAVYLPLVEPGPARQGR